jgi:hypothetical protein
MLTKSPRQATSWDRRQAQDLALPVERQTLPMVEDQNLRIPKPRAEAKSFSLGMLLIRLL